MERKQLYIEVRKYIEKRVNSCRCCKSIETHGEVRNWDRINGEYITIPQIKVRVCSQCTDKEGNGRAFIPREISEKEIQIQIQIIEKFFENKRIKEQEIDLESIPLELIK